MWASHGPGVSEDGEWPEEDIDKNDLEGSRHMNVPVSSSCPGSRWLVTQGSVIEVRMPGQIAVLGLESWVWTLGDDRVVNEESRPQAGGGASERRKPRIACCASEPSS